MMSSELTRRYSCVSQWLKVSKEKGQPGIEPSVATASDGSYPIARPLHLYTLGEPAGVLKEYVDWILSDAGQQIVLDLGYVPLKSGSAETAAADDADAPTDDADAPTDDAAAATANDAETTEQATDNASAKE